MASKPRPVDNKKSRRAGLFGRNHEIIGSFADIQPQKATLSLTSLRALADPKRKPPKEETWVIDAYGYYDEIEDIGFLTNLQANQGARCLFHHEEWDDSAGVWKPSKNPDVQAIMDGFKGPTGGTDELKRRAMLHLAIGGESNLLATPTADPAAGFGLLFEFLGPNEIKRNSAGVMTRNRGGHMYAAEELGDDVYLARCWRSHPNYSGWSDSPIRRVLGVASEITALTQMIIAVVRSHVPAGLFFIPAEAEIEILNPAQTDVEGETDTGTENKAQTLAEALTDHAAAAIEDHNSSASIVPLIISVAGDLKDKFGFIPLSRDMTEWAQKLREECYLRLSRGMDADPGVLQGKSNSTHWNGWLIDDDLIEKHVIPAMNLLVDFINCAYLRLMLQVFYDYSEEEAAAVRLSLDPSPIKARSDAGVAARVLHDMLVINDEALRSSNGFSEATAPTDKEIQRRLAIRLLSTRPDLLPVLGPTAGMPELDYTLSPLTDPGRGTKQPVDGQNPNDVNGEPVDSVSPSDPTKANDKPVQSGDAAPTMSILIAKVATAADAAIDRAFEVAGSRVLSKARKDSPLRSRTANIAKREALTVIAPSELDDLGATFQFMFHDAWKDVMQRVRGWVRVYCQSRGCPPLEADEKAARAASNLVNALTMFVVDHQHDTLPRQANGLLIGDEVVQDAFIEAGIL